MVRKKVLLSCEPCLHYAFCVDNFSKIIFFFRIHRRKSPINSCLWPFNSHASQGRDYLTTIIVTSSSKVLHVIWRMLLLVRSIYCNFILIMEYTYMNMITILSILGCQPWTFEPNFEVEDTDGGGNWINIFPQLKLDCHKVFGIQYLRMLSYTSGNFSLGGQGQVCLTKAINQSLATCPKTGCIRTAHTYYAGCYIAACVNMHDDEECAQLEAESYCTQLDNKTGTLVYIHDPEECKRLETQSYCTQLDEETHIFTMENCKRTCGLCKGKNTEFLVILCMIRKILDMIK